MDVQWMVIGESKEATQSDQNGLKKEQKGFNSIY